MSLILASASPRRKELISFISDDVRIIPSDADETLPEEIIPSKASEYLSAIKAESVYNLHPDDIVIGCDTIVLADDEILGKPKDREDAFRMLKLLSGNVHQVITGVTIISKERRETFSESTDVEFYPLSDEEIYSYIDTKDPFDKAGAYGIQTQGCLLVRGVKGDFFNVVGLPVAELKRHLDKFFMKP